MSLIVMTNFCWMLSSLRRMTLQLSGAMEDSNLDPLVSMVMLVIANISTFWRVESSFVLALRL